MRKYLILSALLSGAVVLAAMTFQAGRQEAVKSRAYVGHENDQDVRNFVRAYPKAAGTRLDDCVLCHRAGVTDTDTAREFSACGYCHLIPFPNPRYATGLPGDYRGTLNAYGLAYVDAGRTAEALKAIAAADSDGDGASNAAEIAGLRHPGDPASRPGQTIAPSVTLTWDQITALPSTTQFMLMNAPRDQFDDYVLYRGVGVRELFEAAKVDLSGAAGITVFAPDGYAFDYALDELHRSFPKGVFYEGPRSIKDKAAFVREMALAEADPYRSEGAFQQLDVYESAIVLPRHSSPDPKS